MANRLVSVDENLNLPPAVQEQLTSNVRNEFTTYLSEAETAASSAATAAGTAASSASTASSAASTAQAAAEDAVAVATGDLDPANAVLINNASSATRVALNQHYLAAGAAPTNVVNVAEAGLPTDADVGPGLNALIAAASAGDVLVGDPNITYTLNSMVTLNKPITLRDIKFQTTSYIGTVLRVESSNVTLDRVSIQGVTNATTPELPNYFVFVAGNIDSRIDGLRIKDCFMRYNRGTFIRAEWCTNFEITGNVLMDGQYGGIMMISGKVGRIIGNRVQSLLMSSPLVNSYGIGCTDLDNTEISRSEHVLVMGNYVEDVKGWAGIDTHSGNNIKIIGNTAWNCWLGINVVPGNSERLFAPKDCVVTDNTIVRIDTPTQNAGIVFSGRATLLASGYMGGNVIRGYDTPTVTVALDQANWRTAGKARVYGSATTSVAANGGAATVAVTYPAGLFKDPPFVTAYTTNGRVNVAVGSATRDGCNLNLNNWTTAAANSITVEWRAEER